MRGDILSFAILYLSPFLKKIPRAVIGLVYHPILSHSKKKKKKKTSTTHTTYTHTTYTHTHTTHTHTTAPIETVGGV